MKTKVRLLLRQSLITYNGDFGGWEYSTRDVEVELPTQNQWKGTPEVIGAEYLHIEAQQ